MRIVLVASRHPFPARRGNQVRTNEWMEALAGEDVRLVCPGPGRSHRAAVETRSGNWRGTPLRTVLGLAAAAADGRPLQEGLYDSRAARAAVARALHGHRPDVLVVQMVRCAWAAGPEVVGVGSCPPVVFDAIDAMGLHFDRAADAAPWPLRTAYALEAARCRRRERSLSAAARLTAAVSQRDLGAMAVPEGRGRVVPVAGREVQGGGGPAHDPTVVLTGNLGYRPTVEGALWFAERVWPRVRERVPNARWVLAGARPSRRLRAVAGRPGVELLADVDDMAPVLEAARVAIAPMNSGSGVPMKVLEACAAAVPVVLDPWAAAGLEGDVGDAVGVAATPEAWVEAVVELLRDEQAAIRLGNRGRELWRARYRPEVIAEQIRDVVSEAASSPAPGRAPEARADRP